MPSTATRFNDDQFSTSVRNTLCGGGGGSLCCGHRCITGGGGLVWLWSLSLTENNCHRLGSISRVVVGGRRKQSPPSILENKAFGSFSREVVGGRWWWWLAAEVVAVDHDEGRRRTIPCQIMVVEEKRRNSQTYLCVCCPCSMLEPGAGVKTMISYENEHVHLFS